jgi:hypothetical protein
VTGACATAAPAVAPAAAPGKRVAAYGRRACAASESLDVDPLTVQRALCEEAVAARAHLGWALSPVAYEDAGWSGLSLDRPGLRFLLEAVDGGRVDIVLVPRLDRVSRKLGDVVEVAERIRRTGASLYCLGAHPSHPLLDVTGAVHRAREAGVTLGRFAPIDMLVLEPGLEGP